MDVFISISIIAMLFIAVACIVTQLAKADRAERLNPVAPNYRTAATLLICITLLITLLFGSRLFLKPDVRVEYATGSQDIYVNVGVNDKAQEVTEFKKVTTCSVTVNKNFPLFTVIGREQKQLVFKMPCDRLLPEMKTEITNVVSFLKDEKAFQ